MSDWFVGFRPSPKSPQNLSRHVYSLETLTTVPVSLLFSRLTQREGIDVVIDETVRFDARHGGKLRFLSAGEEGYGGTYSRIDVPKRVILLTEKYGEIDVRLREKGPSTLVSLRATKLAAAAEEAQWRELIDRVMERFVTPEGDFPHG